MYHIKDVQKDMYFRLRGTNLACGAPTKPDRDVPLPSNEYCNPLADRLIDTSGGPAAQAEAAWKDLWFYEPDLRLCEVKPGARAEPKGGPVLAPPFPARSTHPNISPSPSLLLHLLLFGSGLAGLGYEMVWTRLLTVGLGHEMVSVLAVVSAFFAGFAWDPGCSTDRSAAALVRASGMPASKPALACGAWLCWC